MDCLDLPDRITVQHIEEDRTMLGVDAGMMAAVDPLLVDSFLAANTAVVHGYETFDTPDFRCHGGGFLAGTGGDGLFPFSAHVRDKAVHAVEICFDDWDGDRDRWIPGGLFPAPSGRLVIGDPGFLSDYTLDPTVPPIDSCGLWAVLTLPGPGWVAVHVFKHGARVDGPNLVLRADWLAG